MRLFTAIGLVTAVLGLVTAAGITGLVVIIAIEELEQRRRKGTP